MPIKRKTRKSYITKSLTTIEMEVAISDYFGYRQNIIVPNISWGFMNHEADIFVVQRNGYVLEIEIKRSKSDLLADHKKKHKHQDEHNRISELYYALPEKLYDSCKDLIPKSAGILTCDKWLPDWSNKWSYNVRTMRKPIKNSLARKLTDKERLKIAHLGTMRIWSLKKKIIKLQDGRTSI